MPRTVSIFKGFPLFHQLMGLYQYYGDPLKEIANFRENHFGSCSGWNLGQILLFFCGRALD
jgi:hypothetical protein